jgi:guanosine-3',5'-bis(diphosphate) 3'-pyrophosphohydrolase
MNRKQFFALLGGSTAGDMLQIQLAYWLSKNAHRPQAPRDGGARYFEHPREVAMLLIERGYRDKDIVTEALLHDTIEDTNTPPQIIVNLFGHDTWEHLFLLSKVIPVFDPVTGQVSGVYKKTAEEYKHGLMSAPFSVRVVKCADRVMNLRDMKAWERERQLRYASETEELHIPLAANTDAWFEAELISLVKQTRKAA